jgi:hypothetical protein
VRTKGYYNGHVWVRERDSQRTAVYRAEDEIEQFSHSFNSRQQVERFVNKTWEESVQPMTRLFIGDPPRVDILPSHARSAYARPIENVIAVALCDGEATVLHELAHIVSYRLFGCLVAGHGWQYCAIYLDLVEHVMGRKAHKALKASFERWNVQFEEQFWK